MELATICLVATPSTRTTDLTVSIRPYQPLYWRAGGHLPPQRSTAMRVKDVMTDDVKCCSLETNLAAAAKIMWEADCGAVPVTDGQNKVIGVITDRDICIAGATRSRTEGEIPVQEVISRTVYSCSPNDDVRVALETMRAQQVRRLPVVGQDG